MNLVKDFCNKYPSVKKPVVALVLLLFRQECLHFDHGHAGWFPVKNDKPMTRHRLLYGFSRCNPVLNAETWWYQPDGTKLPVPLRPFSAVCLWCLSVLCRQLTISHILVCIGLPPGCLKKNIPVCSRLFTMSLGLNSRLKPVVYGLSIRDRRDTSTKSSQC